MGRSSRITDSESDLQTLRFAKKSGLYKDGVFHHLIRADHMHFHANASLTDWQRTLRRTFRSYDLVAMNLPFSVAAAARVRLILRLHVFAVACRNVNRICLFHGPFRHCLLERV